ncbi:MAG: glycoside hydrolase family 9 protein [Paludibacter sp.]|nr:glycoside hydrolase family 9 protein [Paludibacter sp.]
MVNKHTIAVLILIHLAVSSFGADSWIRINQLGYLPNAAKKAVLLSEKELKIQAFTIHDALTDEQCAIIQSVKSHGSFDKFNSTYILDFSSFKAEGAYYIKIDNIYSPTLFINKNIFVGSTDKLIDYMHLQRFGGDVSGGWWYDGANKNRNGSINATAIYQLLYSYNQNPLVFADRYDYFGKDQPNGIPDIIDEAKWGLDWLVQANYKNGHLSMTGKFVAAFALGADVLSKFYPDFSETLSKKAIEIYEFVKNQQQITQNLSTETEQYLTEENWKDDMQLAATQLYFLTYNTEYLLDAVDYGASEPVPQWLFSTCDKPLQFYPYINWSPILLQQVENPNIKKTFLQNIFITLQRAKLTADDNPFNIGISFTENSNNKIVALHNLCIVYRQLTKDNTFIEIEESLYNWIFGCNPWGISMVIGLPEIGHTPVHPHSKTYIESDKLPVGGLLNGAISNQCLMKTNTEGQNYVGIYERFQTDWAVYRDHVNDYITNQPNIDGTSALFQLLSARQTLGEKQDFFDKNIYDKGGINRFNPEKKQIAIIFTGHQYADGYTRIRKALNKHKVKASFFFSGDFLRKKSNASKVKKLFTDGHYIGPATNHYVQLADWNDPESNSIRKKAFLLDLKENYGALKKLGIGKQQAPFFNPPFELYNDSISRWCKESGVFLIRSTPGTLSNLDYTFPEMRENYYSSKEIFDKIMLVKTTKGLNGYILQFNFGANPGRKDKFYNNLPALLENLKKAGYEFVDLFTATDVITYPVTTTESKKKKK